MKLEFWSNEAIKSHLLYYVEQEPGGCWIWQGTLDSRGYAICWVSGREQRAARLAYQVWKGPILPGNDAHHRCRNRRCINPAHLQPMVRKDHLQLHRQSGVQSGVWLGVNNGRAKLSEADVQFIKVAGDFVSAKNLALQFGVSLRTVYHVLSGRTWRHVKLPIFPRRSYAEADRAVRETIRKSLSTFMRIRGECRERGIEEPSHLDQTITLSRLCLSLGC